MQLTHVPKPHLEALAQAVVRLRDEFEFHSFWLGVRLRGPISPEDAQDAKYAINRAVGLRVIQILPALQPTHQRPDAVITLHYPELTADITPRSLLLYGRYRKLSREIPQSKWHCKRCWGRGCPECGGTGRRFQQSVEELVAEVIQQQCQGRKSKLHSIGREDVDARMLGRGRPFIIELTRPRVRTLDPPALQAEINRRHRDTLEIAELQTADAALLKILHHAAPDKSYRATVACLAPVQRAHVAALENLRDLPLAQETPRRVLHRRANKTRTRTVRSCALSAVEPSRGKVRRFDLTLRAESGTYIKEFASGDEGRTFPSIAHLLRVPCECTELDVLEIHYDPVEEWKQAAQRPLPVNPAAPEPLAAPSEAKSPRPA